MTVNSKWSSNSITFKRLPGLKPNLSRSSLGITKRPSLWRVTVVVASLPQQLWHALRVRRNRRDVGFGVVDVVQPDRRVVVPIRRAVLVEPRPAVLQREQKRLRER